LEREIEEARMDVVRRLVSPQSARDDYGVALDPVTFVVDAEVTERLRRKIAAERGPSKLIDRGAYAETLIRKGLISVSDMDVECTRCADDSVLERYWKDLYKYTVRPIEY
jgi:N-methylhydantoinase B